MKAIISLVVLTVFVAAMGFGQGEGTSALNISTFLVGTGLLVTAEQEGEWGTLSPGTVYTITPNGLISPPELDNGDGTISSIMYWGIESGTLGGQVQVSFILPAFFSGDDFGGRIPYSVTSSSAGAFLEEPDLDIAYQPFDPRNPHSAMLNIDGLAFVALGGVVSVGAGVPVEDTYTGTFILTAQYAGF